MGDTRISTEEAKSLVSRGFGVEAASLVRLDSYEDENFLVTDGHGKRFVLKVARQGTRSGELEAQNVAMERVATHSPDIAAPRPVASSRGEMIVDAGDGRLARLLSFIDGEFLVDVRPHPPRMLRSLGRMVAKIDRALLDLRHEGAHRTIRWDLAHAHEVARDTDPIVEPRLRADVDYLVLRFEEDVVPVLSGLRHSVVHNDANDHNVLVSRGGCSGLIDFGDLVHTATVFDLAIAVENGMLGEEEPLVAGAEVVAGYHEGLPLEEQELEVLFPSLCARLAVSVVIASREASPENPYVGVSQRAVRALISKLMRISPDRALRAFRGATGRAASVGAGGRSSASTLELRKRLLGRNLGLSYASPLKIVRGAMQYLFDDSGRAYLDCVNNVCHVGHSHAGVVRAIARQAAALNTNTRYLHDNIVELAERLTATLPAPLRVCYFVNSGSEANDLAMRMAKAHTGRDEMLVLDGAYHGTTAADIGVSPYKFDGPGGAGAPSTTRRIPMPDPYRGAHRTGEEYARDVRGVVEKRPERLAAFIAEPLLGVGGQVVPPAGFFASAFKAVRAAGGITIADEVQTGFGRVGSKWWAFELHDVIPDIVTMGKPMGNGHPIAAVVTTEEIAASFANGMEYFNTYGGNPVSCAAALAVLDAIERDELRANASRVGDELTRRLKELQSSKVSIGDVRGHGLFLGVDLVRDRDTKAPDGELARAVIEKLKSEGILLSRDGPGKNVLKIKPPMPFSLENADELVGALGHL